MTGISCRKAAVVIAVSDFTARETATLLGVSPSRIHTVYHGVSPVFHPLPEADVAQFRQRLGLPDRFILHIGTLEPRKNLLRLTRAFARLSMPDVHLVLAGGRGWLYDALFAEVDHLGIADRVHFPGYVDAQMLTLWYNAAEVFAYISNYEGFGLPVLEALACGVPTLTANTSSLPEASGDAALLVSPDDESAITEGLRLLLSDTTLRTTLRQRGLAHAAQFTWERSARQTVAVYRHAMTLSEAA
jgi:glycosyltransferase involved in cell wall biosynthesis